MTGAEAQAVLLGIAGQCPNTGGDAVYRARSLYQLQHPEMRWEDGVLCEPAARNVMWGALPVQATVSRLKVWPNPTKGMLFLEIPSACGVELRLQVLDMLGRTVKNIALETDSSPASIPLKGMNGGIYFLKLFCQGQLIGSEKIILSNN
ncbi:MAG TPA: T9SS type A sorting domain-containing protein [Saprospiraceae bacterium]|nr:T9SS type A sorting domain-containing protein [Saprospiraceae bacterium]